jgi:hypothetical protein
VKRNVAAGFLDRPEAGEVDLPGGGVPPEKRRYKINGTMRVTSHDLVDPCALSGVVLVDPL